MSPLGPDDIPWINTMVPLLHKTSNENLYLAWFPYCNDVLWIFYIDRLYWLLQDGVSFVPNLVHCITWQMFETCLCTVYPKKYAHGFVVLCFVVVMQSFIMNSHEVFIHIHQGCFACTGAIVRLPQCQWSKPDGYGKVSQCITTTKHSKAKTVCIFLRIYCMCGRFSVFSFYIL